MATLVNSIQGSTGGTHNQIPNENATFYVKALLSRLTPELKYAKFASKPTGGTIPKRAGDTASFRRVNSLAINKTPLVEGVTPEGKNLTVAKIPATVAQYGDYTVISDLLDTVGLDPMITEASQVLGEQAGQSIESIITDVIYGGSSVYRALGVATQILTATTISYTDILNTKAMLKKANVKEFEGGYVMFVSNKVANDLMQLTEWKDVNKNNHDGMYSGELGKLAGVRFVEVSDGFFKIFAGLGAGAKDIYSSLMIGKDYFGMVDIEGSAKPEMFVFTAGSTSDPLAQRNTVGWKCLFATLRINEACGVRLETL